MKLFLLFSFLMCFFSLKYATAQQRLFSIPLSGTQRVYEIKEDWNPELNSLEGEVEDGFKDGKVLEENKKYLQEKISKKKSITTVPGTTRDVLDTPYVWRNLQGNLYNNSVPNDNDVAISNTGYVVSVMNSTVFMYDLNADTTISYLSLDAFATPLGNINDKYDPKAIYDPVENKFVVVFLAGFTDITSSIIVAFSQSDHPGGGWNFYELPGNPLNDTLWSDYPIIALTNHELFVTVNHLHNDEPWQTGWVRSVIWQVNKMNGYNGASLSVQLHDDVAFNGKKIRNLCPVKGGSTLYGPGIYFMSQRNLDVVNDTFFLVHVSDTIGAPGQSLNTQVLKSDIPYFVPIDGKQSAGGDLATNDSRVLGAFFENDRIQFAGNTTDTLFATAAIYHGIISNVSTSPALTLKILSDDTIHYGYPNLAYNGNSDQDNSAILVVMRSAVNLFSGYSVIRSDGEGSYSPVKNVKNGQSYVSVIPGTERWGDYSGAQRKYDEPGKVWVNGSYGTTIHKTSTWIAEIALDPPPTGIDALQENEEQVNVFPNPLTEKMTVKFKLEHSANSLFELIDMNGIKVKTLLQTRALAGKNEFTFSLEPLATGTYFLRISANGNVIATEKVIKL
ncbi:MAG: T9SS type A sorting domain-containing protein [Chitinophagales bacterium]